MRSFFIILFLFTSSLAFSANFNFNQNCKRAYEKMMIFDFESANKILVNEKALHPNNLIPDYISTYILFWKAALNEEEDDMDIYEEKVDELIDEIEDASDKSAYKNFLLSDIYLRGAYIKGMQTSYMSAAYKFNRAYNLVQENKKEYPNFIPNKKLIGLMNVGIGTVPKKYNWVLKLFNFEGNVKEGLKQLEDLLRISANSTDYHFLMSESLLLYSFTMETFEVSKSSEQKLLSIYEWESIKMELPQNQFMIFSKASFLKHIKKTDEAIACIQGMQTVEGSMHFYYLDFLMGECLLNKLDYSAANYFARYAKEYHGNSYRRAAYRKWAWTYLLQGNRKAYEQKMAASLEIGNDNRNADQQATKEAENKMIPNVDLLKARLLFDGGYYEVALQMLNNSNKSSFSKRQSIEFVYRKARIYDDWNKTGKAITYYKKTIELGRDETYYFAANAALHLGYIYEKQGRKSEAKIMYKDCLDMDFDEYQEGINQKAKAALERLED
jgi:hypothetical protein